MSLDLAPNAYVDIGDNKPFGQNHAALTLTGWVELDTIAVAAFVS